MCDLSLFAGLEVECLWCRRTPGISGGDLPQFYALLEKHDCWVNPVLCSDVEYAEGVSLRTALHNSLIPWCDDILLHPDVDLQWTVHKFVYIGDAVPVGNYSIPDFDLVGITIGHLGPPERFDMASEQYLRALMSLSSPWEGCSADPEDGRFLPRLPPDQPWRD